MSKNIIYKIAWGLLILGVVILVYFFSKASIDGYTISQSAKTNYTITGQFGDFVGGVVGTFFALAGTLLIFLTFSEQTKENKRTAFESSFFEMIRLYRENINELRYRKYKNNEMVLYENRQVVRIIFQEFIECYREVIKFSNSKDISDYLTPKYTIKLKKIVTSQNRKIDLIDMARIDIAYSIIFYGLGEEGESTIRKSFLKKYNSEYFFKLLYFMKLKPKKSNTERFKNWEIARKMQLKELHPLIDELYSKRKNLDDTNGLSKQAKEFKLNQPYEKYYGGHQFRLGHYFRHLYQSYKYLNNTNFTDNEKYAYGKMYRAQLSTYEQALLLINSLSSMGMKWELNSEETSENKKQLNLITKYNLIKNLPGEHISGVKYKNYYPNVMYETDEQDI